MSPTFQDRSGVPFDDPPCFTPSEQGLQTDPVAVDAGLGSPRSTRANLDALSGHERGQGGGCDAGDDSVTDELNERIEVTPVGSYSVWRPSIVCQVIKKLCYRFSYLHGALLLLCLPICVMVDTGSIGGLYQEISDCLAAIYRGVCLAIGLV